MSVFSHHRTHIRQSLLFGFMTFMMLFFGSGGVYAEVVLPGFTCNKKLSTLDCNALINNNTYWVPDDGSGGCGDATTTLTGSDNAQKAYNFFTAKGLPGTAAAGILGNLQLESGINPKRVQDGKDSDNLPSGIYGSKGYGIAQWTSEGRQKNLQSYAKSKGTIDGDLGTQLDFLWKEASGGYSQVIDHIKAATSAADAATQWMGPNTSGANRSGGFENPRASTAHEAERRAAAEKFYQLYGKDTPGDAAVATGTSNSSCDGTSLANGDFIEYKQCAYPGRGFPKEETGPWVNAKYGHGTLCDAGCGPSAMAMIITNLTGQRVTPDMTASYGAAHGTQMPSPSSGSLWNIAPVLAGHWGLKSTDIDQSATKINQTLQAGGMVLATGQGPNPFTEGGHFIVIRALTADGKWMTGNSAGYDSSKPYAQSTIMASLRHAWAITK